MKHCSDCAHFKHRQLGLRGGQRGSCELSSIDTMDWKHYKITRRNRCACNKFKENKYESDN